MDAKYFSVMSAKPLPHNTETPRTESKLAMKHYENFKSV
jgi:hypothetical protein